MAQWEPISDALYATQIHRCDLCGKMLVKRLWHVEYNNRFLKFCDEQCEQTWFDYWLPRYGAAHGFTSCSESRCNIES